MAKYTLRSATTETGAPSNYDNCGSRASVTLADGRVLFVTTQWTGTTNQIKVYELNSAKTVTTLRATLSAPSSGGSMNNLTVGQYANGDLSIIYLHSQRTLLHYKLTIATWTWGPVETVVSYSSPTTIISYDVDVSDAGAVFVAANVYNGSNATYARLFCRPYTSQTWQQMHSVTIGNAAIAKGCDAASVVCLASPATEVRSVVWATGVGKSGSDYGVRVYTTKIGERYGSADGPLTLRETHMTGEGDTSTSSVAGSRVAKLFRISTDEYWLGIAHTTGNRKHGIVKGTFNGTTWTNTFPLASSTFAASGGKHLGMSVDKVSNTMNFYIAALGGLGYYPAVYICKMVGTAATFSGPYNYHEGTTYENIGGDPSAGAWAHLTPAGGYDHAVVSMTFTNQAAGQLAYVAARAVVPDPNGESAIVGLLPQDGAQVLESNPQLTSTVDLNLGSGQSKYKVEYQFATDSGFTTNLITYTQDDTKFALVNGTDPGPAVNLVDTLPGTYSLFGAVWYWRARLIDEWGHVGLYATAQVMTVGHAPTVTPIAPAGGETIFWNGGQVSFDWLFTDPAENDYQTAYQVQLYRASDDFLVLDTTKVLSSNKRHTATIAGTYKDVQLYWVGRAWDSNDSQGQLSDPAFFTMTDPPTVAITAPTEGSTVATGVPTFQFLMTTGGTRQLREYTIAVLQAGRTVWSKRVGGAWASGTTISEKIPQGYLGDSQSYTVQAQIIDSSNLIAVSNPVGFTVDWVPPATPTGVSVDISPYNVDDLGYISVLWDDLARDADFTSYIVYRKDDLIDPVTSIVLEEGDFKIVFVEYETGPGYEFKDFFAPSNYKITYRISQTVNRDGQDIESLNTAPVTVYPQSDGYWLIEPTSDQTDADAFKLSIVTGDSFTDEQEEAEFTVIGRGRVVNKGQKLGNKGTLDCRLRNTGGTTARQKRLRLKRLQEVGGQLWLRNPFGDTFRVNVSAMSISRIAGVGSSEFCDVSIPYAEVSK